MIQKFIFLLVGALMLSVSAHSETIGVVMMHGKHGTPSQLQQLAATVANAGFLVERPEMCWSATRIYDQTYLECFCRHRRGCNATERPRRNSNSCSR